MQLNMLRMVLPADVDETNQSSDQNNLNKPREEKAKKHSQGSCGSQLFALIKDSVCRVNHSKWVPFCRHERLKNRRRRCRRRKYHQSCEFYDTDGMQLTEKVGGDNPRIFSYAELYIGSNGFSEKEVLGSGGFGKVYKAVLPSDGTAVAVKCLVERGDKFEKSFVAELVSVAHLRHRNLVRLRGWCVHDDHQLLLVYDYMPNRSLDRVLFRRPENMASPPLSWDRRRKIIDGLAAALFYLHEQLETQIIHRDVKASNVMLDSHYNARLGDFGLARWLEHGFECQPMTPSSMKDHRFRLADTTKFGGTIGYLPPESFQQRGGRFATAKSDVFSFGIVVLEVVSGRKAVDLTYDDDQIILLDWIRRLSDERKLLQAVDTRLQDGSYGLSDMERLIHIALLCTLHNPHFRPNMKWVMEALSGNLHGELPTLPSFQSHPPYISLSSTTNTSSSDVNSITIRSTSTVTTTTTATSISSNYMTAKEETVYATAENGISNAMAENGISNATNNSCGDSRNRAISFPMVQTPREISFAEITSATDNFSDSRRVAELDFGTAYHGFLSNHQHILVKRLGMKTCPALRARFGNELKNLGRLRHRNLVQLRGWCTEQGEMLVVYDYSPNRLLSHLLFHHDNRAGYSTLLWHHRYNIMKSLASALHYLHEEWDEQVIHRSITSSAVIIDPDMNPRLSSFALAQFLARNEHGHHVVIDKNKSVRGIFGYMSPEYMKSGEATTMADVYSFGVVMLEAVSGQMAVDFRRPEVLLVKRVHQFLEQKRPLEELADTRLNGKYNHKEVNRLVKLGIECTGSDPKSRPSMSQIVTILDGNDQCFMEQGKKESIDKWKEVNASSLSLVKRIQALGIQ